MISNKVHESYLAPNFKTHLGFLEDQIKTSPGGGQFLCGDKLAGPDILVVYALEVEEQTGLLNEKDYPNLTAYLHRLKEREQYKQAASKVESIGWSSSALPRL